MRARSASPTRQPAAALRESTDAQLLALAATGQAQAFDAIVDRYRPALLRYCSSQTRAERVDDAVQQTFVNAWLALGRGVQVRELRPWLYSIARNASIDQLRLHRGDQVELSHELAGGSDPAMVTADRDEVNHVLRAVAELPERQRTALLETAVHGKPTQLVADEMGMSGGALRQLVHRARTSVRGMVASFFPGPLASWFAQATGDEGTRRVAMLFGAAGQSAGSAALAATATVASVGAIGTAGIASLGEPDASRTVTASVRAPRDASRSAGAAPQAGRSRDLVQLPLPGAASNPSAGTARRKAARGAVRDQTSTGGGRRGRAGVDERRARDDRPDGAQLARSRGDRVGGRGTAIADGDRRRGREGGRERSRPGGRGADPRPEATAAAGPRRQRQGRRGGSDGGRPPRARDGAPVASAPTPGPSPTTDPAPTVSVSSSGPAPAPALAPMPTATEASSSGPGDGSDSNADTGGDGASDATSGGSGGAPNP